MLQKLNTVLAGIIIGILLPAGLYFIFIMPKMNNYSFIGATYFREFLAEILPMLLSRCIFPNALLFFILIWRNQTQIAKGLLISSGILTAILLFVSFVL